VQIGTGNCTSQIAFAEATASSILANRTYCCRWNQTQFIANANMEQFSFVFWNDTGESYFKPSRGSPGICALSVPARAEVGGVRVATIRHSCSVATKSRVLVATLRRIGSNHFMPRAVRSFGGAPVSLSKTFCHHGEFANLLEIHGLAHNACIPWAGRAILPRIICESCRESPCPLAGAKPSSMHFNPAFPGPLYFLMNAAELHNGSASVSTGANGRNCGYCAAILVPMISRRSSRGFVSMDCWISSASFRYGTRLGPIPS